MARSPEATQNPEAEKKEREVKLLGSYVGGQSKPDKKTLPNGDWDWDLDSIKPNENKKGVECAGQDRLINKMDTDGYVVLSDGMGGYKGGGEAAQIIVTTVSQRAEAIEWEKLSSEESKVELAKLALAANQELEAQKAKEFDESAKNGTSPKLTNQAGGTLVFVKIDKLGREHRLTIGDSIYASAHDDQVLDLDVEETMAAASVGGRGYYSKDQASTLINVIGSPRLQVDDHNVGVRQLEPGIHRGFVTSDGLEEVYRDRSGFKMGDGTSPGNLLDVFKDAMLNAPNGQVMAQLSEANGRNENPKFDDQLGCEFSVEIQGVETNTFASPEVKGLNPIASKMLAELGQGLEKDPTEAIKELDEKVYRLVVGSKLPDNEFELEVASTIFPAVDALREHAGAFNVDPDLIKGVFENLQTVIDNNEEYFDRKFREIKDGHTPTKEEISDLVANGNFLELDRMLALYEPDENYTFPPELADLDEICENFYNLLANPVMQAVKAGEGIIGDSADSGFAERMKAQMIGGGINKLVRAQEMLGSRRGKVAVMAGFVALGLAGFAAQKFGLDLHFGGAHHADIAQGGMPHDALHDAQVGHNIPLHLPAGMEQHGDKVFYQGHEVGTIHTGVHGEFGPHEQQQLLSDMHKHGLDVSVNETLPSDGLHHANAVHVDHREWFTGSNELKTDVSVHGNRAVISIEGMHGQSHMGSEHFDPTKVQMHALVTDENGHTFDLPIHDGKAMVDKHSDIGRMLADHTYKKVEIAHLAHHNGETTAQMVSTDIGHDSGALPAHPTTGHEAAAQHSYSIEVKQTPAADAAQNMPLARNASSSNLPPETVTANGVLAPVVEGAAAVAGVAAAGVAGRVAMGRMRAARSTREMAPQPETPETTNEDRVVESAEKITLQTADSLDALINSGVEVTLRDFETKLTEALKTEMPEGVSLSEMQTALQNALNKHKYMFAVEISDGGEVKLLRLDSEVKTEPAQPRQELIENMTQFTNGHGFNFENTAEAALDIGVFMFSLRSNFGEAQFMELMHSIGVDEKMLSFSINNGEVEIVGGHEQEVLDAFRNAWESRTVGA